MDRTFPRGSFPFRRAAVLLACAAALILCSACKKAPEAQTPAPVSAPTATAKPTSSPTPKPTPTPRPTPTPTPAPTPTPEPEKTSLLPPPENGSDKFRKAFSENAIDRQFELEYTTATSAGLMTQACREAALRWQYLIDVAYGEALNAAGEGEKASIKESQDLWASELEESLAALGEESGDQIAAALNTVLFYRERGAVLCELCYTLTGSLPDFEAILDDEVKG